VRLKIQESMYFKQHCFALTAATAVDRAVELKAVGGTFGGGRRPVEFLCLTLKLLMLGPEQPILLEYVQQEDFKCAYVRCLPFTYSLYTQLFASSLLLEYLQRETCNVVRIAL
jgi:pre-mRNA-splicing factor 38A